MRIDTFLEWFVIFVGCTLAIGTLWPRPFNLLNKQLVNAMPHPDVVAQWLRDIGL
jgi:hypothetical protein